MLMSLRGITRIVFIFRGVVIKIPNFTCQHDHFLAGCLANYKERLLFKHWNKINWHWKDKVAPTYYCSWFGLIQIQARVELLKNELSNDEFLIFKELTTDTKKENFGYFKNRIVCIDFT